MSVQKAAQEKRPFGITEEDYNALEDCIKSLQLTSMLASEHNSTAGGIPAELVSASLDLVTKRLDAVRASAEAAFKP